MEVLVLDLQFEDLNLDYYLRTCIEDWLMTKESCNKMKVLY